MLTEQVKVKEILKMKYERKSCREYVIGNQEINKDIQMVVISRDLREVSKTCMN